jgi:hypothetical protein
MAQDELRAMRHEAISPMQAILREQPRRVGDERLTLIGERVCGSAVHFPVSCLHIADLSPAYTSRPTFLMLVGAATIRQCGPRTLAVSSSCRFADRNDRSRHPSRRHRCAANMDGVGAELKERGSWRGRSTSA